MSADPPASERLLGFWMTLALVIGNIIGAGIFLLPASLAPFGQNAIYGWLLTIAGALCLAWVLAKLAGRIEGGPYAYVHLAFGKLPAFAVMWSYWISIWTAVPALAIAAVSYLSSILPALGAPLVAPGIAIASVWVLTLVNMRGARSAGAVQLLTTVLKLLPLIAVVIVAGMMLGRGAESAALTQVAISPGAIAAAAALSLFSMVGFESATVPVGKVRNAARIVPLATLAGTAAAGLVYLIASTAVLYLLPGDQAATSAAPFADAIAPVLGGSAGTLIAAFAIISALGCLNGWVLCSGEVPLTLARNGVFPRWFAGTSAIGTPIRAQLVSSLVATLLIASNYSRSLAGLFGFMILVSTVVTLVLYATCATAALVLIRRRQLDGGLVTIAAVLGLAFSLWAFWGAGAEASLWGMALLATGVPVWIAMRLSSSAASPVPAAAPAAPPE
jgi:APA family basic amino acid/polyamine antiporter